MRPDLTRLLARTGAILAVVVGGSLSGLQPASAAGSPPVAYDDFATTTAGQPVDIVLSGSDADGEPLTFSIASPPTSGTLGAIGSPTCDLFGSCDATVTYTPTNVPGVASFTFTVNDGSLTSAPATVDITVDAPPPGSIISAGPLTRITTTATLNCAVNHSGDQSGEWFGGTACGTLVAVGASLYGPSGIPAGGGATGAAGYQAFTPVSQAGPTGAGTQASPYVLTTVVDLGTSGVRLAQTDTYVVGQESYRTDLALTSRDGAAHSAIVYRAGDCYLQDSDQGLGQVFSGNSPNCKAEPGSPDPNRVEGFFPLTGPSHYMEAGFSEVWSAVGAKTQLPDTCRCAENIDNGIGLSWAAAIAAAGTTNISSLTNFSPVGAVPVSFSKTADHPDVAAGAADGYTVTLTNPGAVPQTLTSITDTLPVGFTYVAGSTTGVTTAEPTVSGRDVTWTGTFTVPAATGGTPGTRTLHFGVTASQTPGTYTNSVTGSGTGVTVLGANGVAPVTVTGADTTPPDTTITAGPSGTTNDSTPTFSFTSTEAGSTFQCRVDGGAWVSCTSPFTTAVLADGSHTFEVRATDAAGNTDATPASRTFTVDTSTPPDTTPPDTTITAGPTGTTNDSTPTFSFTATEAGSTFQCRIDGGAWASCTSPFTTAVLADGSHTFEVRATDAAGNTDATPASRSFTVDATAPDTTITAGPTGTTNDSTPTFSFTSTEAGSTFQCRVDGGAWVSCTSPFTTAVLADGSHTFEVRATDAAGNTDATPASRAFTVDTTAPDTTITAGPTGTTNDSTPTFSFTASEAGSTFQCRIDGGAWVSCASPFTTTALADGAHTFEVRATDAVGNTDPTPAARTFTVATAAPVPTCFGKPATVVGTVGNDVLTGTGGADVIVGLGGKDKISGGGGDDLICGGDGDDVLRGAGGDDHVDGGTGNDDIGGGGGDDVLLGGDGDDRIKGNGGDDEIDAGAGDDQVRGAAGDDDLVGGPGDDRLYGQGGNDHLSGGPGRDKLDGGPGRDRGDGGGGQDVIVRCES
ncbi:hypothetical protein ASG76_14115 [Nocardioides sp. Soil774]|nr:hypothetical protein ASG76_14115 [Nocardioides sp. Soil774]